MGIFDIFRKKDKEPTIKQAAPTQAQPTFKEVAAPTRQTRTEVSWSKWPAEVPDYVEALRREHAHATQEGLHMLAYSYEGWSPGSVGFKKFGQHPLGVALLNGVHVVEVGLNHMDELQKLGMGGGGIPQLWAMAADGSYSGETVSGGIWGADTPENIDRALRGWFRQLGWLR